MSSLLKALRKGNTTKHEKLLEDWDQGKETLLEGLTFYVKYLGSCLVESPSGEQSTAEAIKNIITMAKASGRKLERVALTVSPKSIKTANVLTQELKLEIPISRISYCSADAHHDHVFAFIQSNKYDIMECHAFLCAKKKMAQAVTLTISQAFNVAYELWQVAKNENHENKQANQQISSPALHANSDCDTTAEKLKPDRSPESKEQILLIDLDSEDEVTSNPGNYLQYQKVQDDFFWENHFAQFSQSATVPALGTNVFPDSFGDAFISQFVVVDSLNVDHSSEFFRDDANDLLLL